jgi:predicted GIY-YIG superfamily endonuclease
MASDKQGHRDRRPQTARRYSDPTSRRRPSSTRWLVDILRCSDGSLYTGITNDLPKRLKAHASGKASRYTRSRLPVTLVCSEPQKSKSAALKREAAIKKLPRTAKEFLVVKTPPKFCRR